MGVIIRTFEFITGGLPFPAGAAPFAPFSLTSFNLAFTGGLAGFSFDIGSILISAGAAIGITALPTLSVDLITATVTLIEGALAPVPAPTLDRTSLVTIGNFATLTAPFTTVSTPGFPFGIDVSGIVTVVS